ncbi:MAG: N-formylglutamate amidohydrolase [Alphaproteobacteria bacterium]|nr:N-formylglutamate amidohydrolase [Alphaproteobacteria bacterium]
MSAIADSTALLASDEPPPAELFNEGGNAPTLLLCDHAGRRVPKALGDLGVEAAAFERHIAWDIGAAEVARRLSVRLDAPLVYSNYSRLVVDVNRRPDDPTCVPEESDGTKVPGNLNLSSVSRTVRLSCLHEPYHRLVDERLSRMRQSGVPSVVSVHSFTPVWKGIERPWHIGVLWNRDGRLAQPLIRCLAELGIVVGDNQPYSGQDEHGYTLPRHVERVGIPHVLLEIRQDLIDTRRGAEDWSEKLYAALGPLLADPALRQLAAPA